MSVILGFSHHQFVQCRVWKVLEIRESLREGASKSWCNSFFRKLEKNHLERFNYRKSAQASSNYLKLRWKAVNRSSNVFEPSGHSFIVSTVCKVAKQDKAEAGMFIGKLGFA